MLLLFALAGLLGKVLLVFAAVLWHESAHAITARSLGLIVREIEIFPFGGVARINHLSETEPLKDFLIAAAGPISSLLLTAFSWLAPNLGYPNLEIWNFFFQVNIALACFNLLPALPLDGGRMLRACLSCFWGYQKATEKVSVISKLTSVILLVSAIGMFVADRTINISFLAASIFLYTAARAETKIAAFRVMQVLARKKELLTARGILPTVLYTAVSDTSLKEIVRFFQPEQYNIVLIVDENLMVKGQVTETQLWEALTEKGLYTKIGAILE